MKISSLSVSSIESNLITHQETKSFQQLISPLLKTLDRIGTSIALGEAGNLDAAHEFRNKNTGQ